MIAYTVYACPLIKKNYGANRRRPFKCTFKGCGKDFKLNQHLFRHISKTHTNELTVVSSPGKRSRIVVSENKAPSAKGGNEASLPLKKRQRKVPPLPKGQTSVPTVKAVGITTVPSHSGNGE